jgi:hypothetical protein
MKSPMFLSLGICLTCVSTAAVAQNGYTIKEVARGDSATSLYVAQSNSAGWIVTTKPRASEGEAKDELRGPGGYFRDISAFTKLPDAASSGYIYPLAVTEGGSVYFEQAAYSATEEQGKTIQFVSDRKLLKLDRDASKVVDLASFKRDLNTDDGILVNAKGQVLYYSADTTNDPTGPLSITRNNGKRESIQKFTLPAVAKAKEQSFTVLLDDTGKFVLSRSTFLAGKNTLSDLCSGSVDNETITCMDTARVRSFSRKGFYLSQLVNGVLLLSTSTTHESLDVTTFEQKSSFRVSALKSNTGVNLTSNGSAVTFASGVFKDSRNAKFLVSNSSNGKSAFVCDVIQQLKLPWLTQIQVFPGVSGGILLSIEDRRPQKSIIVLLLTPATLSKELPSDVIGSCRPIL